MENTKQTGLEIAVIGMAGRFPGAKNLDEYWNNLIKGMESISFFSEEELEEAGIMPNVVSNPDYVKAHGELQDKDYFDNSFFGYTPKEIEIMDPQIRVFHESAWEALEQAGYDPTSYRGSIALYGGGSDNFSWRALEMMKGLGDEMGFFARSLLNNGFLLSTRVSHKLDLKGPSVTFFTACSTSLVAIHLACRALLMGECHLALAGGVSVTNHVNMGYLYEEGMILSPDGHCRTFDAKAKGSVYGEGVGIVVLKRLKSALEDGDTIHAVIKNSAVNNDGINKASFTAPGISGISSIIKKAMKVAHVKPEDIRYVEAHGTATPIGDTLEIKSLKQAFNSDLKGYCRIGSVKSNIGHLDTAAGVAAFIKTILAIKHKLIPPSLHFEDPNPDIDFENSPFTVNTELSPWTNGKGTGPLIAGVNGFGIGGNNAFIVVEEAPEVESSPENKSRDWTLLLLSARTESALNRTTKNLEQFLLKNPGVNLADAAYTLQVGRKAFNYRRTLVCRDNNGAVEILANPDSRKIKTAVSKIENREIIFMFSGLGSQYVNMGLELYQKEKIFRRRLDRCFEILTPLLEEDLKEVLFPPENADSKFREKMNQVEISQIVLFIFEYALAGLLIQWGIIPQAMIGYSFGEYVAACLSGVLSLEDALELIVYRGELIKGIPEGLMLSVPLSKEELIPLLPHELSIGIDNGPSCIVSGPKREVEAFETQMKEKRCLCMPLPASHAIHSAMMTPILEKFKEKVSQASLNKPQIPYISNVTGTWITFAEVTDPDYWARHLGGTIQFADGVRELVKKNNALFVEIGPGRDLSALVQRYIDNNSDQRILNLIRHPEQDISDVYFLLSKIGQLWLYGKSIDWAAFYSQEKRKRIPLPTYPFEGQQFLVKGDPIQIAKKMLSEGSPNAQKSDVADWFYVPSWKRMPAPSQGEKENSDRSQSLQTDWLVFMDVNNWGKTLVEQLKNRYGGVTIIRAAQGFEKINNGEYTVNPADDNQYEKLFARIREEQGRIPGKMIHLWNITAKENDDLNLESIDSLLDLGYYCLLNIARAIGKLNIEDDIDITVVTDNMQEVVGGDQRNPGKTTLLGPVKGIPKEYGNISLRSIDIRIPPPGSEEEETLPGSLINECFSKNHEPVIAFRNHHRWIQTYEPVRLEKSETEIWRLKDGGVYLVTGGLGGIGHVLAQQIVRSVKNSKLILTGRTQLPEPGEWDRWLEDHDEEDSISAKIIKVRGLEEMGAEVLVGSAESSNLEHMQQIISRAEEQFGPINGVVHSAGLPDGAMIQVRTREQSEILFSAKLKGTLILEMLLKDVKRDFFVFCSSIDSIVANAGHVGYCSANSFLNAFATYKSNKDKVFTVAINWPRWQSLGMAVIQENLHKELKGYDLSGGLEITDGVDAFSRILGENLSQVAVAGYDLGRLYERDKTVGTEAFMAEFDTADDTPENLFQRPDLTSEYVAPQDEIQQSLAQIWQRLFGIEKIGIQDDFFELGGDSLKVVITISKIHKELDVEIPVSEFFNTPNIRDLARFINSDMDESKESTYLSIEPAEEKEYYTLSSAQRRLYVLQQMEPESIGYNETKVAFVRGKLDKTKFEEALNRLIRRHEIYRTSIHWINGTPCQRIHPPGVIELTMQCYRCENEDDARRVVESFAVPFNLSQIPLLRAGLIAINDDTHILIIDTHHIITDKTSDGILVKELLALYRGEDLPGVTIQYRDYAEWQNNRMQQKHIINQEEYWRKQFEGEIPVLNLPYDYSRPEVQSLEGNGFKFTVEKEELDIFKALARELDATLYMLLLSIFNIFLARLSGQEDIVIGTPVSGRRHAEIQNSVGLFINTLALRNYPRSEKTGKEFIKEIRENTLKAFDNQDYPIEEIIDRVEINRDMSRSPLFDAMFVLQNMDERPDEIISDVKVPDFKLSSFGYETLLSRYDLIFEVYEGADNLSCTFQYCTKLFKLETIERFVTYFKTIAAIFVKETDTPLGRVEFLSKKEKAQILYDFNDTKTGYPAAKTLEQLFAEQVERTPDNIAVVGPEPISVTYKELDLKSRRLAYTLIEKGVIPGSIVGIMVQRSIEMMIALLGILKTGGAYLPVDPEYPAGRINDVLEKSDAVMLVSHPHLTGKIAFEQEIIDISDVHRLTESNINAIITGPGRTVTPVDMAYVIYTSGSTGSPKGVVIQHRSAVNFIKGMTLKIGFSPGKTILALTTISFDIFFLETLLPVTRGMKVLIADEERQKDPALLTKLVAANQVDMLQVTPSRLKMLMSLGDDLKDLAGIESLIVGGEAFPSHLFAGVKERFPGKIYNVYGPTETTIWSTVKDLSRCSPEELNIGSPIANTRLYIVDRFDMLQPLGVAGEFLIGGMGVAAGYLNNPELTAQKFERAVSTGNPCPMGNDRFYRTGDLARWLPNGEIEFLGRMDYQVKVRGFRIELEEVEEQLLTYQGIKEVVVAPIDSGNDGRYLCAYVVSFSSGLADSSGPLPVEGLREHLAGRLPDYMIPSRYISLERIPLTANGKIDRNALPQPDASRPHTGSTFVAPSTKTEETIARIWKQVLNLEQVGIHDNFFALGGNSLTLISLNNQLKEVFEREIPMVDMFKYLTIREFTHYMEYRSQDAAEEFPPAAEQRVQRLKQAKNLYKRNII